MAENLMWRNVIKKSPTRFLMLYIRTKKCDRKFNYDMWKYILHLWDVGGDINSIHNVNVCNTWSVLLQY